MARLVEVSRTMPVPHRRVWVALADLASHARWMRDARRLTFTSEKRRGIGTTLVVDTRLGPFRTMDVLEVTRWDEGRSLEVVHRGVIRGRGVLSAVAESEDRTTVEWKEELTFPWWLGGRVTALAARPVLRSVLSGNLGRLERLLVSSP